jgi:hypothetical protein
VNIAMDQAIPLGKKEVIGGRLRVYYYGYWVRAYEVPADTLLAKKRLIEALTRRLFNHVEHGLNVPGARLEEARRAYTSETDPQRQRVKAAMLAGALFNRAADVFTKLVEMQSLGVGIDPENTLMRQCGNHLEEALELGKVVLHRSGEEGIDELWGEPFKAFAFPIEAFYNSRYIKIAQSMQAIDGLRDDLIGAFAGVPAFEGIAPLAADFARAARDKCETLRTDPDIFDVWTSFVVSAEKLGNFVPHLADGASIHDRQETSQGLQLVAACKALISYITRARVPMPKSAREFSERCQQYRDLYVAKERSVA